MSDGAEDEAIAALTEKPRWTTPAAAVGCVTVAAACLLSIDDPMRARAAAIAGICLVLWLLEAVPAFVPTLLLLAAVPLSMRRFGDEHAFAAVLRWPVDPVLALFFGGFVIGVAAQRHRIDQAFAHQLVTWSRGRPRPLIALVLAGSAFLSMWMSNIAATAMMLAALAPITDRPAVDSRFRRAVLIAVAFGANLGGMATPIGSGPNALALAAAATVSRASFVTWMSFAVPITVGSLGIAFVLILARFRMPVVEATTIGGERPRLERGAWAVLALITLAIGLWLTEPLHGIPAPLIAFAMAAALFATRLLEGEDLRRIDWSTLLLIAGGISLGRLFEHAGLTAAIAEHLGRPGLSYVALVAGFVAASAILAAIMSNTGTASMLIPIAMAIDPHPPVLALLLALAASFGMPFVISTPQNAMVYGRGVPGRDFLVLGGALMVIGCVALVLLGQHLAWFIPAP